MQDLKYFFRKHGFMVKMKICCYSFYWLSLNWKREKFQVNPRPKPISVFHVPWKLHSVDHQKNINIFAIQGTPDEKKTI
jgi:hypothetical protein